MKVAVTFFLRLIHARHPQFFFLHGFKFPHNLGNWRVETLRTFRGQKTIQYDSYSGVSNTEQRETIVSFPLDANKAAIAFDSSHPLMHLT